MPAISVLMSVYNGEKYLKETIDCILDQSFRDFEFIVINDGSTDDTEAIIKSFHDPRLRYFRLAENSGVGKALNYGLQYVQGEYVAKADADDLYHPDRLLKQKNFLDNNKDIAVVGTFVEYFADQEMQNSPQYLTKKNIQEKQKNSVFLTEDISEKLYWFCCVTHSTIMARSEIIKKIGYSANRMGEDYYLLYQLNKSGYQMANLPEILTKVRVTNNSITALGKNKEWYFKKALFEIKGEEIRNLFQNNNQVYLWGAGEFGQLMLEQLKIRGLEVAGFIDGDQTKQGKVLKGKTIYGFDEIYSDKGNDIKVLIASQPGMFQITDVLKQHGFLQLRDFVVL